MTIKEINKMTDQITQLQALCTVMMQEPTLIPAFLQGELAKLAFAEDALSKVLETVADGSPENTAKQLGNTIRSVIQQNRIMQTLIPLMLMYITSKSHEADLSKATIKLGGSAETVLKNMFKSKFK